MHTDLEIIAAVRAGELPALTTETIPQVAARLKEISAGFARAMLSPYVGPGPFSGAKANNVSPIQRGLSTSAKPNRKAAVALLLKAECSTIRRQRAKTR